MPLKVGNKRYQNIFFCKFVPMYRLTKWYLIAVYATYNVTSKCVFSHKFSVVLHFTMEKLVEESVCLKLYFKTKFRAPNCWEWGDLCKGNSWSFFTIMHHCTKVILCKLLWSKLLLMSQTAHRTPLKRFLLLFPNLNFPLREISRSSYIKCMEDFSCSVIIV